MYYVMTVTGCPRDLEEWLIERAFDVGASGMAERLQFEQRDYEAPAEEVPRDPFDAEIYFYEVPPEGLRAEILARAPGSQVLVRSEADKDWLEEWKKGYESFEICPGIDIVPRWKSAEGKPRAILMEPGMAFGTGTHETTQLTAVELSQVIAQVRPQSLLDVGTGTGILAMIAARLDVPKIEALDADADACRVVRENLAFNKMDWIGVLDEPLHEVKGAYDCVVANIVDHVLLQLREDLFRVLSPKGVLVLGGVLIENLDDWKRDFHLPQPWVWVREVRGKEWAAFVAAPREA
jgi:ribosomal protein L11 methyltransferase